MGEESLDPNGEGPKELFADDGLAGGPSDGAVEGMSDGSCRLPADWSASDMPSEMFGLSMTGGVAFDA
jgi:hypothetical protein